MCPYVSSSSYNESESDPELIERPWDESDPMQSSLVLSIG